MREDTLDDRAAELPVVFEETVSRSSSLRDSGGAENKSPSDIGRRQSGQRLLELFITLIMHLRQKTWAQQVITISVSGDMQMGQSKSSPSCSTSTTFFSNSGFFETSADS